MRQAGTPRRSARDDLGSSFTEYAALILLVAAVFAAVAVAAIPGSVRSQLEYALCVVEKAADLSDGDCTLESDDEDEDIADAPDPEDFIPQLCQRGAMYEGSSFNVKIIGTFESETSIQRIDFADGAVWYTAVPADKSAGFEAGYGFGVKTGKDGFNLGGTAHAEVTGDWSSADRWVFEPDERAEADAFEEQLRDETSIGSNPVSALWNTMFGDEPELPEPEMEINTIGGSGSAEGSLDTGISLNDGTKDKDGKEKNKGELDFGQGLGANLGGSYLNIVRTDRTNPDDPITSTTNQVSGTVGGSGQVMLGQGAEGDLGWTSGVREDRGQNGELRGLYISSSFDRNLAYKFGMPFAFSRNNKPGDAGVDAGGSTDISRTVDRTYIYVQIDNEEERQAGEAFLDEYGGASGTADYFFESMTGSHGYFEEQPGADAPPWADLFYDKAQVWRSSHDRSNDEWELGASGRFKIFSLGGGYGETNASESTKDAWYLGRPEDGSREQIRYDDCISSG